MYRNKYYQVKHWVRLTTTVSAAKVKLAIKNTLFDRSGVPDFVCDLLASGYTITTRTNLR